MLCQSLLPVISKNTRVLLLGSMPSKISIEKQQYYANPRNQFWTILYSILSVSLPDDYDQRVKGILECGIGLWDVLSSCQREGSADDSIHDEIPNDFSSLRQTCPNLQLIAFNGTKASKMWQKHIPVSINTGITVITLPSSSPALAKPLVNKIQRWSVINKYLKR